MVFRRLKEAVVEAVKVTLRGRRGQSADPRTQVKVEAASAPVPGIEETAAGGRRVLLLDDEEAILLPTAKYFRGLGWSVDFAREAEEGEALVSQRHYDLAILDVRSTRFGGTAGLEVLREIRRRDQRTSVIVLSAYASPEVVGEARRLGAAAVLRKPQPLPALAHLALTLLEGSRAVVGR
jgi:CheY-like chemotaxis protein